MLCLTTQTNQRIRNENNNGIFLTSWNSISLCEDMKKWALIHHCWWWCKFLYFWKIKLFKLNILKLKLGIPSNPTSRHLFCRNNSFSIYTHRISAAHCLYYQKKIRNDWKLFPQESINHDKFLHIILCNSYNFSLKI